METIINTLTKSFEPQNNEANRKNGKEYFDTLQAIIAKLDNMQDKSERIETILNNKKND